MATREQLKRWVDYANDCGAVILFDAAYEAFITEPEIPTPFSRLKEPVPAPLNSVPFPRRRALPVPLRGDGHSRGAGRGGASLRELWNRRQCTKFNGTPISFSAGRRPSIRRRGAARWRRISPIT